MELEIIKNAFLEIERINTLKSHVNKLVNKSINGKKLTGEIEIDISYRDINNNECFKSIPFKLDLELDEINPIDLILKKTDVYVVDGRGISVDCHLNVIYDNIESKEIEIIKLDDLLDEEAIIDDEEVIIQAPAKESKEEILEEKIEKIKEDLSKDYQNKLADNLNNRENNVAIVSSKSKSDEAEFLRFFDSSVAQYYSIKTLVCPNEEQLNQIAKEYKIPISTLLKGYDRENGKVTFKLS